MSDIRIKMAKDLRDMSDMVGDLHWMAAKAVEDLIKKDARISEFCSRVDYLECSLRAAYSEHEETLAELAQRDARIAELEEEVLVERDSAQGYLGRINRLRAELSAIKAQEPVQVDYVAVMRADGDGGLEVGWLLEGGTAELMNGMYLCCVGGGTLLFEEGSGHLYAAPVSEAKAQGVELDHYDAGLLNDFGGGNVDWWQDYIRAELGRAHDFYQSQFSGLNAAPVQQVSVPDEMRSLAQRLREYNQNPHHINPMSEAFHILVADAANAISTACVPKEISAAITWSEHLLFECGALTSTRAPSVHVYNKTFAAVNEARAMLAAAPAAPAADACKACKGTGRRPIGGRGKIFGLTNRCFECHPVTAAEFYGVGDDQ